MAPAVPPLSTWLVRHGQSTSNAGLPAAGNADVPLTELGIAQARAVAAQVDRQPDLLIVSPYLRARATAEPIAARWPNARREIWPIAELNYLSPERCANTTAQSRKPLADDYWRRCDPAYIDGPGAESFAQFMNRVRTFHDRLLELSEDFVIAIGHGQFFRALLVALPDDFATTREVMRRYRAAETADPIANGAIVELRAADF
jgi:broad specificity phosphatase PhoE